MESLWQDLRRAARSLAHQPGFTIVAVLALALGIGANTAIFSVVNAVLLGALPYRDADGLVTVWESNRKEGRDQNVINLGNFFDWKARNDVFEDMATFFDLTANLTTGGDPEEIAAQAATPNLFPVLGVTAAMGRTLGPDDGKQGGPRVVVISHGLWQRRFGGDPDIVGKAVTLNARPSTVIGVLPAGFGWHVRKGSMTRKPAEIWVPWQVGEQDRQRLGRFGMAVARLKPGVTLARAQAEMKTIGDQLEHEYKDFNANWGVNVVPLRTQFTGEVRLALIVLLFAVGFLLLIACVNVANLLLVRASARQREMAVRVALGAGRWRIVRQLLTESVLLSVLGGAAGLILAWWGTDLLVALCPPELLSLAAVKINGTVLAFTLGVSLLTGIVFGLVPALESTRVDLADSIKEGVRGSGGARSHRLRSALVVAEVAMTLMLLVSTGLLVRSFTRLQAVDPGFNAHNLLTLRVSLPGRVYDDDRKILDFFQKAVARLGTLPGVQAVGAINSLPFATPHSGTTMDIEGRPKAPPGQEPTTGSCVTDAGWFRTMQIPLERGRLFTAQEAAEMRHVVVVNDTFVRKYFPNEDPLGKRVTIDMKNENQPSEIVGVVRDSRHQSLDGEVEPMAYWPQPELVYSSMTIVLRTQGDPASLATPARRVIQELDPNQPVADVRTMESLLAKSTAKSRFNALLLAVFAIVALVLASVGVHGVIAYSVTQRTREFGIRMALGAGARDILGLVLGQGVRLVALGSAIGLAAAFALTRLMSGLLYGVSATDPATFVGITLLLVGIAMFACYVPARRAVKVDPIVALRYE